MIVWPKARLKNRVDGFYRMDLRIKEGKVLLVIADYYIISEDSFLSAWLLKKKGLVKRPDDRIEALELEFVKLKKSLLKYVDGYKSDARRSKQVLTIGDTR